MISVIITAYNVEKYIEEAVASVARSYDDLEIIVVNDASTDRTADVLARMEKEDARIHVVENIINKGAGMSRAVGLANAHGEYVMFVDGDDWLMPDYIAHLAAEAERTGADIVSGGVKIKHEDGSEEDRTNGTRILEGDDKLGEMWGKKIVYVCDKIIRRELFRTVPYCKRRYIEDTPVIIPLIWLANKVACIDEAGYVYRMRGTSLTHTSDIFKNMVFRGLCLCDLLDFFNAHDPSVLTKCNIIGCACEIFDAINATKIQPDHLKRYADEWLELSYRLFNYYTISKIDYQIKK